MGFLAFYAIGFFVAAILTSLFLMNENFFHHVFDNELLSDPTLRAYTKQIATIQDKSEYDVLYPLVILTLSILSYLGVLCVILMFIDYLFDSYENKSSKKTKRTNKKK